MNQEYLELAMQITCIVIVVVILISEIINEIKK